MATATKAPRKTKQPAPELTLDQVAEQNLRELLGNYREQVEAAADGRQFDASDLAIVEDLLRDLELPTFAWDRDVAALKKHRQLRAQADQLQANRPAEIEEAKTLTAEIPHIERRLAEARAKLNELTNVRTATAVGLDQRLQELKVNHPHILGTVDRAVELKLTARRKRAENLERSGWLS